MLTEYEVRRRMENIRVSRAPSMRKARLLLTIGRSLKGQVKGLARLRQRKDDANAHAAINRMVARAEGLRDDVRDAARAALEDGSP